MHQCNMKKQKKEMAPKIVEIPEQVTVELHKAK